MKSIFISGSGKCGETFFYNLFKNNPKISAHDETRSMLNSFYKFSKYYKLNIDEGPLFKEIKKDIVYENNKGKIRLESSSFLSFHLADLHKRFNSKIIVLLRNPYDVVHDLKKKGWYNKEYYKENFKKKIGYQGISTNNNNKHHNFTRISPAGKYFKKWNKLNSELKIKWYWDETYKIIFKDLKKFSKKKYRIIKIEEFDFKKYLDLCKWLNIKPNISEFMFNLRSKIERNKKSQYEFMNLKLLKKYESTIENKYYNKYNLDLN